MVRRSGLEARLPSCRAFSSTLDSSLPRVQPLIRNLNHPFRAETRNACQCQGSPDGPRTANARLDPALLAWEAR